MIARLLHRARRLVASGPGGCILGYHGIADVAVDPWALFVSPENFRDQMRVLRERFHPVLLSELNASVRDGVVPERAIAITFDDGYANNLHTALPILREYDIPATVFVPSAHAGESGEFWWDELEQILLRPSDFPETLRLDIAGARHTWAVEAASSYTSTDLAKDRRVPAAAARPGTRMALYREIWELIRLVANADRRSTLDQLAGQVSYSPNLRESHRSMTMDELSELDQSSFVDLGGHGHAHLPLGELSASDQRKDIEQCKGRLERFLGHSVHAFCYPFGSHTAQTARLAREAGYDLACAATNEAVGPWSDPYRLPRFMVFDWDGETFARHLEEWILQ